MRRLPWRAAPKATLASPLTLVAASVTALLACFLATAAVLHASAAGGAAVDYQSDNACPDAHGPAFTGRSVHLDDIPRIVDTVRRHAAEQGFGAAQVAMYTFDLPETEFAGTEYKTRLGYADGGIEHLQVVEGDPGRPGLSMGTRLALEEDIPIGTKGQQGSMPPIVSLHSDLDEPVPRWWCSQRDMAVQQRIVDPPGGAVIFATERETFTAAARAAGTDGVEWFNITFPGPAPRDLDEAYDQVRRSEAAVSGARADLARQGLAEQLNSGSPFARSAEIAQKAQTNVLGSILPLAFISVLVGIGGVGTVGLQWFQRRHSVARLLAARGTSPAGIGGLAVAELGLPLLVGGVSGAALAWLLLDGYGPPGHASTTAVIAAGGAAAAVLLVSLGLLAAIVAHRSHREFQLGRLHGKGRGRILAWIPWELVTAALALFGWIRLTEYRQSSGSLNPLPQVDPIALTYPVFVVLTAAMIAARLAWLVLRLSPRAVFWSRPTLQLAIRRMASARAPVIAVLAIGVVAIGTLSAGNAIADAQRQSLDTKSGTFVGANSRVDTEQPVGLGEKSLPAPVRDDSTVVGELTGTGSVVLVVDPTTVGSVAWLAAVPDSAALLRTLGAAGPAAPTAGTPAIRVGHTSEQALALPDLPDARPVADVPVFPIIGSQPGYVISRDALTQEQLASIPRWSILSSLSPDELSAGLADAGVLQLNPMSRDSALDALPFYVVEWSFAYVTMLGAVLGLVAALALLVAVEVRRRQNALAGALVLRMGLRPRALLGSYLLEVGALAGLALLTGVVCGAAVAGISVPRFDPAGWLAPQSELPNLIPFVLGLLAAGAVVVALAGWLAMRSVRTARTAELLRG
ncbi:putative ABC transport system permease protein [Amycolatopsis marina]|uniref:Putative ABC transport system permease protein n=1 Tax=Amycolatopsis marina TaxID=490629 RepID=A0A1I1BWT8_9PSEU|nr:permease [Amycolatopsis marina]SFB54874.1 putative ABC transport system permease protein [Amycolatopsis marina]